MRKAAGLTQEEAANKLNINRHTFGAYERGRQTEIRIKARVLGAFSRPAKELAERQASAISAATALQM